jgi:hypothetical protein
MGKTFKDQRDWDRKQSGRPRRNFDDDIDRNFVRRKFDEIIEEEECLAEYDEFDLDELE